MLLYLKVWGDSILRGRTLWQEPEGERLEFLFEQDQNRVVEIFNGKTAGRGGKDSVITRDTTQNTFGFA